MLKTVVGFLDSHDLQALPEGRFEWDADGCFVNLQTIPPKAPTQAVLESHKKMIDIQIPLTGDETMGYSPLKELKLRHTMKPKTFHSIKSAPEISSP